MEYHVRIRWRCGRCRVALTMPQEALDAMRVVSSLSCEGKVYVHVNMAPWACPACGHALGRLLIEEGVGVPPEALPTCG